jgi:hypothetical protein
MHPADHDESLVGSRITEREHIEQPLAQPDRAHGDGHPEVLRNEYETIDEYNAWRASSPSRTASWSSPIFVGFEGDSFRAFLHRQHRRPLRRVHLVIRDLRPAASYALRRARIPQRQPRTPDHKFVWKDEASPLPPSLDAPPHEAMMTDIMDVVGRHAKDANRVESPSSRSPRTPTRNSGARRPTATCTSPWAE